MTKSHAAEITSILCELKQDAITPDIAKIIASYVETDESRIYDKIVKEIDIGVFKYILAEYYSAYTHLQKNHDAWFDDLPGKGYDDEGILITSYSSYFCDVYKQCIDYWGAR